MTGRVWFGVLAPPLAWAAQLVTAYAFEEAGCGRPDSSLWGAGLGGLTGIVVIACGVLAVAGGAASFTVLRVARPSDGTGLAAFLAAWGVSASFIFLLAIVLTGISLVPLDACTPG
ncbi:MAG TPA: hypothetical protein VGI77_07635 [Gaiellaceae bacterium]|jgi:hypothetical protein